eukprot:s920_g17.t1
MISHPDFGSLGPGPCGPCGPCGLGGLGGLGGREEDEDSPGGDSNTSLAAAAGRLLDEREETRPVLCAASQRLALGRREGTSRVAIGPPRSAIRGRKAASMPEAPTPASRPCSICVVLSRHAAASGDHLGGAAALVRDVGASMPKGLESSTSVTTTPPAWCDRKPPESSSSSRSNATTSAGTSVVRRTSAPSSAGSTVLRSSWVDGTLAFAHLDSLRMR